MTNREFYRSWYTICWFLHGHNNTALTRFFLYDQYLEMKEERSNEV